MRNPIRGNREIEISISKLFDFAIPRSAIDELVRPKGEQVRIERIGGEMVAYIRGARLPVVDLSRFMGLTSNDEPPSLLVDAAQVLRTHRYQVLARTPDHHHRIARRVDEVIDYTQQNVFHIPRLEADQVRAVVLARRGRRQFAAVDEHQLPAQPARRIAIFDTLEPRDPAITLRSRLQHVHLGAGLEPPSLPLEQSLRRVGERLHPQPAAHAVRRS